MAGPVSVASGGRSSGGHSGTAFTGAVAAALGDREPADLAQVLVAREMFGRWLTP
ncbi:hypothetical protein [Micromonospora inositola]|uniref:hypothetical protein n=1 Tax=Micromonospora inositola TaxID=47865 RepID=UPI0012FDFDBD|nr:hypothetical protein [Micromonospora inositola]